MDVAGRLRIDAGRYMVVGGRLCRCEGFSRGQIALRPLPPEPGPDTFVPKSSSPQVRTIGVSATFEGAVVEDLRFEDDGSVSFRLWRSSLLASWPPVWPKGVLTFVEPGGDGEGWAEGRASIEALSDITYDVHPALRDVVTPDGYLIARPHGDTERGRANGASPRLVLGEYVMTGGILRRVISRHAGIVRVQTVSSGAIREFPREELPPTFVVSPSAMYRKTRVTIVEYLDDDTVLIGVDGVPDARRLKMSSIDTSPGGMSTGVVRLTELRAFDDGIPER
ncbi:hypothetical protein ACH0AH_10465 [Microbacterium paludicola]|uniref:hypothetical protein n=1 Tax=Microbacterium paludicola TaxID=300019 RepID=UPI003879CD5E